MLSQQDSLEAIAQLLEIVEVRAAEEGKPYQWSPSDEVRTAARDLLAFQKVAQNQIQISTQA